MTMLIHQSRSDAMEELLRMPDHFHVYIASNGREHCCASSRSAAARRLGCVVREFDLTAGGWRQMDEIFTVTLRDDPPSRLHYLKLARNHPFFHVLLKRADQANGR